MLAWWLKMIIGHSFTSKSNVHVLHVFPWALTEACAAELLNFCPHNECFDMLEIWNKMCQKLDWSLSKTHKTMPFWVLWNVALCHCCSSCIFYIFGSFKTMVIANSWRCCIKSAANPGSRWSFLQWDQRDSCAQWRPLLLCDWMLDMCWHCTDAV